MARQRLRGVGRVKRLFKRLPDDVGQEIVVELSVTGRQMLAAVRARLASTTKPRTGALDRGLSQKVFPRSLRLQVGLIGTPRERNRVFYGRILDLGRKAQVVRAQRHDPRSRKVLRYLVKVSAIAPKRFVTGRYPDLRATLRENVRGIFRRALQRAGGGNE